MIWRLETLENIEDLPEDIGLGRLDDIDYLTMLAELEYR